MRILQISIAVLFFLLFGFSVKAQDDDCLIDGVLDLRTCELLIWDIPDWILARGYIGRYGTWVPGLPKSGMESYNPGLHLTGNMSYTSQGYLNGTMRRKAPDWGLDPNSYVGGIALDSCAYINTSAWINVAGYWDGPYLVVDCAARPHMFERACVLGTVGEMDYENFAKYQSNSRLDNVEVIISASTVVTSTPPGAGASVNYPQSWLSTSGLSCSS